MIPDAYLKVCIFIWEERASEIRRRAQSYRGPYIIFQKKGVQDNSLFIEKKLIVEEF